MFYGLIVLAIIVLGSLLFRYIVHNHIDLTLSIVPKETYIKLWDKLSFAWSLIYIPMVI